MKKYIPYIIIGVMSLLWLQQCSKSKSRDTSNIEAMNYTIRYYENALGTVTASKKTLQAVNTKQALALLGKNKELEKLTKEFTKVRSIVHYETVTQIDTIKVLFEKPVRIYDFVRVGRVKEKHYSFMYEVDTFGFTLDSLQIPNEVTVITGTKRKWFLGKQTLVTDVTNSNPYITVTDIKATEVVIPEPWYKKWYVWLATGFVAGAAISN
ncbi:hypothetical protein [uncultured Flavobacterium sp.]|uniref:hypothetical protein n=1 Tax=uncultured Flavobacterium sp. TaxID=165435 RepID=UPI0025E01F29|nr:hypothetical protein [uncultured Flavobacterium sp.]